MRWAIWMVASLIAVVGVVALIGLLLPVAHEATRSAEINAPPEKVFALLADPSTYHSWWSGAGVRSEVVERVVPTKLVTRIVGETAFGGTWTMKIVPTPTGSRLTITERGEVYNVIFRTLSKFVFGYTGTMDSCLAAVQTRLSA